ncbi:MAG: chromosome partitioning protein ParB [Actinomycetota bacterium]|nr:chromosome partitioning protein ParB [Actinomycetota bacterium]
MNLNERADKDFSRARRRAFLRRLGAYLRKDPASNELLSFDEVRSALGAVEQTYLGMRVVPVAKIVGSVGRHRDFDRAFLPSKPSLEGRWKKIDQAMHRAEELPPVSVYKIGDAYFVRDGNHRVSVAHQQGIEMIDAEVIELRSRVPIDSAITARDLLYKLEHRRLLERLPIDRVLPELKVELSDVADYRRLATHIEAHGFRLSQLWRRYVSPEEVMRDWYEYHYAPIAAMIREERVLVAFPERTELDLYLWIIAHRERLAMEARDESVTPSAAKEDILRREGRKPRDPTNFVNIYG